MDKISNIMIVVSFIFLLFLLCFADKKLSFKFKKQILFTTTIFLSIFMAFRNIGLDLEPYRRIFTEFTIVAFNFDFIRNALNGQIEPVFSLLISAIKSRGLGFKTFLFISAAVPLFLIYRVIIKVDNKAPLATYFFFLAMLLIRGPVDIIRAFFAAGFYLSALYSLSQDKSMKAFGKSAISALSHYSSVLVLFIRPFLKIKWNISKYIIWVFVSISAGLFFKWFLVDFIISMETSSPIMFKLRYYLIYYNSADGYTYLNWLHRSLLYLMDYMPVLLNIVIILIALKNIEQIKTNKFYFYLLNSQILGTLLVFAFSFADAHTFGLRLNTLLGIGGFILAKEIVFNYLKSRDNIHFGFATIYLVTYNFFIVLYYAGVQEPTSPFYLLS